jgi:hypothetical protein
MSDDTDTVRDENSGSYFRTLLTCMVSSIGLLALVRLGFPTSPDWLSIVLSMAPLVYYHLGYLMPLSRKGINQAAIDSVYYYGFLVTVVALGVSALTMVQDTSSMSLATNSGSIISQFGVGLFATGYAVIARMHLSSLSLGGGEDSPDLIIDGYISKSKKMIENLDSTLRDFQELANKSKEATSSLQSLSKIIIEENTKNLKDVAASFQLEMKTILADTRDSLIETRNLISDAGFTAERKAFVTNLKSLSTTTGKLNSDIESLSSIANIASDKMKSVADGTDIFASKITDVIAKVENLSIASINFSSCIKGIEGELQVSSLSIKQQISSSANVIAEDLRKSSESAAQLTGILIQAVANFSDGIKGIQGELLLSSSAMKQQISSSADVIAEDLKRSSESVALLTERLIEVANTIIDRTNQQKTG